MKIFSLRRFILLTIVLVLAAITLVFSSEALGAGEQSQTTRIRIKDQNANKVLHQIPPAVSSGTELPPSPEKDSCLHCHITGENTGLWTPLGRWTLFGTMGLIFAFGVYRSANVWVKRSTWKPITTRTVEWVDERYQVSEPLLKALSKPVPKYALRWFYCLGGITAFLFLAQGVTGIMLAFYYDPTPEAAYLSIQFIETEVRFGSAIRAIHHWAANGMIIMCTAHMLRVFIMGAFKPPRELNWVSGVLLLVLTLLHYSL